MITEINESNVIELQLEFQKEFILEEFTKEIVCINAGSKAVAMNFHNRKIHILDSETGSVNTIAFGHHSKNFKNEPFDDNQIGTLFLYKKGFGVLYCDMVFLFEDPNSNEYKMIPIPAPVARVMMPGIPKANNQLIAYYKEDPNELYVLFDEMQRRNSKSFFAVIKLSETKAEYSFWPKHFKFPNGHIESESLAGDDRNNNPILVNFLNYKNQFCIASFGRSYNMSFGKTPNHLYFSSFDDSFNGKEILGELKTNFTNCIVSSDLKFLAWEKIEKAKKEVILFSLETNNFYKINLKSKKNNLTGFNAKNTVKFNVFNNYYWHSDGTEKVAVYKIKNEI